MSPVGEGAPNWRRGLRRTWIALSLLWIVSSVVVQWNVAREHHPFTGHYVHQSDRSGFRPKTFVEGDREVLDEAVSRGIAEVITFPDGTLLIAASDVGRERLREIARQFWEERWSRRAPVLARVAAVALVPPLALLLLTFAGLWVAEGFRPTRPAPDPS